MICEKCGSDNVSIRTSWPRHALPQHTMRRRICQDCRHVFNTVEISAKDYDEWRRQRREFYNILARSANTILRKVEGDPITELYLKRRPKKAAEKGDDNGSISG